MRLEYKKYHNGEDEGGGGGGVKGDIQTNQNSLIFFSFLQRQKKKTIWE